MASANALADSTDSNLGSGQGDFGGIGLMQTPTARMAPVGSMLVGWSRIAPYRRYNVFFQPTEWLEGGFRYSEIEDRLYGEAIAGDRNLLDKGFDMKLRLLEESRYLPELALGMRDLGGTTLFGAEYLVASKRWHDVDVSLGLGWGYLGHAADAGSPLGGLDSRFDSRPDDSGGDQGGEFRLGLEVSLELAKPPGAGQVAAGEAPVRHVTRAIGQQAALDVLDNPFGLDRAGPSQLLEGQGRLVDQLPLGGAIRCHGLFSQPLLSRVEGQIPRHGFIEFTGLGGVGRWQYHLQLHVEIARVAP
jgi:hypothetical protein